MKLTPQEALIHIMVIVSAADRDMADPELARIGAIVRTLPVFKDFDAARTLEVAQACREALHADAGLEGVIAAVTETLTPELRETAYALAVDIVSADLSVAPEEDRILVILRDRFDLDRSAGATIERAAAIRHRVA